jgi:hypothetical protein
VGKGNKQYHQKQQKHTCGVGKGAKQDRQKVVLFIPFTHTTCMLLSFMVVLFSPFYSRHIYVVVFIGDPV